MTSNAVNTVIIDPYFQTTMNPSKSPDRHTFQRDSYIKRCLNKGKSLEDSDVKATIEVYNSWALQDEEKLTDTEWQESNMEFDMRTSDWMVSKVRENRVYAQHLYAAICNNEFKQLTNSNNKYWGASWRSAGGIVADMCQSGDYIDWYCSGIIDKKRISQVYWINMSYEQQVRALQNQKFLNESVISEEILEDLNVLGWAPVLTSD
jgi:hypothetical protein